MKKNKSIAISFILSNQNPISFQHQTKIQIEHNNSRQDDIKKKWSIQRKVDWNENYTQ